jgi:anti-sigma B factor antagonist
MQITSYIKNDSIFIVKLSGEVDLYNANKIKDNIANHLKHSTARNIIINLDEVTYIDSTGIGTLISIRQMISGARGELRLIHVTNSVKKIFELTKLNMLFKILDDEESAIATF